MFPGGSSGQPYFIWCHWIRTRHGWDPVGVATRARPWAPCVTERVVRITSILLQGTYQGSHFSGFNTTLPYMI